MIANMVSILTEAYILIVILAILQLKCQPKLFAMFICRHGNTEHINICHFNSHRCDDFNVEDATFITQSVVSQT